MYKFASKVIYGVLALLFLNNFALGIDAEFKNSLLKIELIKTSDSSYNVDLYTKNQFVEPVKVIKKSDLNYYILLPETKNESTRTLSGGVDIRGISTNVYPYAGQDFNNGYVKININTTKPLDFKVNIKNAMAAAKITSENEELAMAKESKEVVKEETVQEVQKKNSDSSISKTAKKLKETTVLKFQKKEPQRLTIEDAVKKEVERVRQEKFDEIEEETFVPQEVEVQKEVEQTSEEEALTTEDLAELEHIASEGKNKDFQGKFFDLLLQYGIGFSEIISIGLVLFFALLCALFFLNRSKNAKAGIKSKTDINLGSCIPNFKKENNQEIKNDGQYFVFDKNIKQTGFYDPATSAIKRNYELSSYEPDLKNKYNRNAVSKKNNQSEYDIIQKILKEDSFIDLPSGSYEQQVKMNGLQKPKKQPSVVCNSVVENQVNVQETKKEVKVEKQPQVEVEPDVISNVEIAPQRGFMLVSYNDNINLLGYIFDDVFPLYNFKVPKLENYDIKYRLSEKGDKIARFIVKVGNTKMLVAVSKSSMIMEVLM